jgi:dUTP pyrophosphatase
MVAGEKITVSVRREPEGEGLPLPRYHSAQAAGMDLMAACAGEVAIRPGERTAVSAGISIALPEGYEAQIRPRSGLALKKGLTILNAPGTVDADYRGVIKVILVNLGSEEVVVKRGDRIAQMVIQPVIRAAWLEVEELPETERDTGGFGHTGIEP